MLSQRNSPCVCDNFFEKFSGFVTFVHLYKKLRAICEFRQTAYTELQSAVHAMIQRLEYSFTFNPSLLTSPKRKKQVAEILTEAEKYIWRIKEEMRCA